jgi:hypothetical protein
MAGRPSSPTPPDCEWVPIPEPQHEDYYEPDAWGLTYSVVTKGPAKPLPLKLLKRKQEHRNDADEQSPPVTAPPTMLTRSKPELQAASALTEMRKPRLEHSYAFRIFTYNDVKKILGATMHDHRTRVKTYPGEDNEYMDDMIVKGMSSETDDEDDAEEEIPFV